MARAWIFGDTLIWLSPYSFSFAVRWSSFFLSPLLPNTSCLSPQQQCMCVVCSSFLQKLLPNWQPLSPSLRHPHLSAFDLHTSVQVSANWKIRFLKPLPPFSVSFCPSVFLVAVVVLCIPLWYIFLFLLPRLKSLHSSPSLLSSPFLSLWLATFLFCLIIPVISPHVCLHSANEETANLRGLLATSATTPFNSFPFQISCWLFVPEHTVALMLGKHPLSFIHSCFCLNCLYVSCLYASFFPPFILFLSLSCSTPA